MKQPKKIPATNIKLKRGRIHMPLALNSVFYVKNDRKGMKELETLKRNLNTANYSIRIKGRNPDRLAVAAKTGQHKARVWQTVRKEDSTYFAVYIDTRNAKQESESRAWRSTYDYQRTLQAELSKARATIDQLSARPTIPVQDFADVTVTLANERIAHNAEVITLRAKLASVQEALRTLVNFGVNHV